MLHDPYVKSKYSGGSLNYENLFRFAKDRNTSIKIVDFETLPHEKQDKNLFGIEFISNGAINFVAFLQDNTNLNDLYSQYIKLSHPKLLEQINILSNQYPDYKLNNLTFETIGQLYSYLLSCGIYDSLENAQLATSNYGIDLDALFNLLKLYDIKFYIIRKPNFHLSKFILQEIFNSQNCQGIITTKQLHENCLEEYCIHNQKNYLISCGFASHITEDLNCKEIKYTDYQSKCLSNLFNIRG